MYLKLESDFGYGYCPACYGNYVRDERLPPCMESETLGYCAVVKTHEINGVKVGPIELNPDERLAMEVYNYAVSLSGFDMNGLPQITNLQLALQLTVKHDLTEAEFDELVQRVVFIHNTIYKNEADKIPKK